MKTGTDFKMGWGESRTMVDYELDRLFGLALTDARFFQHLKEEPHHAVAQFALTDSEARAVADIAPAVSTVQDLATQLDRWMMQQEQDAKACPQPEFIGLDSAAQCFEISDDILVKMVREGRIRLSKHDVSQVAIQVTSREYA